MTDAITAVANALSPTPVAPRSPEAAPAIPRVAGPVPANQQQSGQTGAQLPQEQSREREPQSSQSASSSVSTVRPAYAEFKVDYETHRVSISIVDPETKEVIREIPPEETERVAQALRDYADQLRKMRAASDLANRAG